MTVIHICVYIFLFLIDADENWNFDCFPRLFYFIYFEFFIYFCSDVIKNQLPSDVMYQVLKISEFCNILINFNIYT